MDVLFVLGYALIYPMVVIVLSVLCHAATIRLGVTVSVRVMLHEV